MTVMIMSLLIKRIMMKRTIRILMMKLKLNLKSPLTLLSLSIIVTVSSSLLPIGCEVVRYY